MNRIGRKKLWQKLLLLDIICIVLLLGGVSYQKIELQTRETVNTIQEKKKVALTFDDGPHPVYTPEMLDVLKEKNVKATFFLLGEQVEKYPDIVTVYTIGDVSKEICTGPHVEKTSVLGKFVIKKEEASSSGVRRIKAILE